MLAMDFSGGNIIFLDNTIYDYIMIVVIWDSPANISATPLSTHFRRIVSELENWSQSHSTANRYQQASQRKPCFNCRKSHKQHQSSLFRSGQKIGSVLCWRQGSGEEVTRE